MTAAAATAAAAQSQVGGVAKNRTYVPLVTVHIYRTYVSLVAVRTYRTYVLLVAVRMPEGVHARIVVNALHLALVNLQGRAFLAVVIFIKHAKFN